MANIVLFDGVCNFCHDGVQFIYKRDPNALFYFASLQGEIAKGLMKKNAIPNTVDSLILIEKDRVYLKSTAALRICRKLKGGWRFFYVFIIIPKAIRDKVYDLIAENRYRWFGKREACSLPSWELRERFLE